MTESSSRNVDSAATYNLVGWATSASTTTYSYPPDNGTPGNPTPNTTTTHTLYGLTGQVEAVNGQRGRRRPGYFYGPGDLAQRGPGRQRPHPIHLDDWPTLPPSSSPTGDTTNTPTTPSVMRRHRPSVAEWTIAYDADGDAVKTVDPDGGTATYTFDAMNRKTG